MAPVEALEAADCAGLLQHVRQAVPVTHHSYAEYRDDTNEPWKIRVQRGIIRVPLG